MFGFKKTVLGKLCVAKMVSFRNMFFKLHGFY